MKKFLTPFFLFFFIYASGQNLPGEMRISADGSRLILGNQPTTGFYREDVIRTVELTFSQQNFWSALTAAGDNDVLASVTIDGQFIDSVGVRFKGATSDFRNNSEKKSFNITLDAFVDGQDHMGYETLNLNGNFDDPSSIREIVYNHIGRNYALGLKTNMAQLYINGMYWGPYLNVQQLNGEYMREWFLSNDGTRWRALQEGGTGGGPGGGPRGPGRGGAFGQGLSTLNYLGPDTMSYIPNYTLKKSSKIHPWEDLVEGTDMLNNLPADENLYENLQDFVDIDKALWFMAHEIIFTDQDGYIGKGGMDYYLYWEAETGRLIPLEYDGNSVMQFNATTSWGPFYREDNEDFPLANRLFASPDLRQRYLAHLRVILADYFTPEYMDDLIDGYRLQIEESIQNDPKRIFEPNEFATEITELKSHVRERRNFLLEHSEVGVDGPVIASVSKVITQPVGGEAVVIEVVVEQPEKTDRVRLYYGQGIVGTFARVDMIRLENGTFRASIPGFDPGSYVRYYVEAIANDQAGTVTYAPKGAEHDVYVYRVMAGNSAPSEDVVINELMASNDAAVADQDGEFDDWIELYNKGNVDIDLTGYFLSDKADNLDKYDFPEGTTIPAQGYLVIWADEDGSQEGLHANFKLSASGEAVFLVNPDTVVIDEITFGEQTTDLSLARRPNGTGEFSIGEPTFNANNDGGTTGLHPVNFESAKLQVYPNPTRSELHVLLLDETAENLQIKLFDVFGREVLFRHSNATTINFAVDHLPGGLYFLIANDSVGQKLMISK